ncbi:MATE family efflux transporter [Chryseobacterium indoltheticum]|uniref:MATE family efflux transporter n=1 Tax=Chryseobacterium indoltheticum TaxID=254 RepID=UPI003F497699
MTSLFSPFLNRFFLFLLTPLFGLMRGLQPVVGINFGAGQFERARQFFKNLYFGRSCDTFCLSL